MLNFRPTLDIACATSYLCNQKTTKRQNNRAAITLQQRLDWSVSKALLACYQGFVITLPKPFKTQKL